MSSGQAKKSEYEAMQQWRSEFKKLTEISENVLSINPRTPECNDLFWLWKNREKIIRNKRVIELMG